LLQPLPNEAIARYQPYWAVAAHLLDRLGRRDQARSAFERAIDLCDDGAVRAFLHKRAAN